MSNNMIIQVIAVDLQSAKSKAGKDYELVEVTYKNKSFQDKVESKKHNQYGDKTVFNTLKGAKGGDVFTVSRNKDDAGYWQWVGIAEGADSSPSQAQPAANRAAPSSVANSAPTAAPRSNFESQEERAKKQVFIVRQSSIGHAVELLKTEKKVPSVDEILEVAKVFEQYVFGINLDADPVTDKLPKVSDDLGDDIPY